MFGDELPQLIADDFPLSCLVAFFPSRFDPDLLHLIFGQLLSKPENLQR